MPSLEELRSRHIAPGTPAGEDIVPFLDVTEVGNSPIKKTTLTEAVVAGLAGDPDGAWEAIAGNTRQNTFTAGHYGADPAASAATNVAALQAALDAANAAGGGTVIIDKAGDYLINATLKIYARTHLLCVTGVAFSKTGSPFNEVLMNAAYYDGGTDEYIRVTNLQIKTNGNEGANEGIRGHISFVHVRHLVIENLLCLDNVNSIYFLQICDWQDIVLRGIRIEGFKDAIHLNKGSQGVIRDSYLAVTGDDSIAFNAHTWADSTIADGFGEISDVLVENVDIITTGLRFMIGSWTTWTNGFVYQRGDTVVNAGKIYRSFIGYGDDAVASVAPTHSSGTVTGADGIPWRFERIGTETETNIRNITFRKCTFRGSGAFIDADNDAGLFSRQTTPGTEGNAYVDTVTFEDCLWDPRVTTFPMWEGKGRMRRLTYNRCRFTAAAQADIVTVDDQEFIADHDCFLAFYDCDFEQAGPALNICENGLGEAKWKVHLSGRGNTMVAEYANCVRAQLVNWDLPAYADVLRPVAGNRGRLWYSPDVTLPGFYTYLRGRWMADAPSENYTRRVLDPNASFVPTGSGSVGSKTNGGYFRLFTGTTAGGNSHAVVSEKTTNISGYLTNFSVPFVISGEFWGQAKSGGAVRILYGVSTTYYIGFTANAGTNPFTSKAVGLEFAQPGGTGNQKARIIAHNGTTTQESDWVDLGAGPFPARGFFYELHSDGAGNYSLYVATEPYFSNRASALPDTPSVTLTGGPTGNGSVATNTGIYVVATGDNSTTPGSQDIGGLFTHPVLEYPLF